MDNEKSDRDVQVEALFLSELTSLLGGNEGVTDGKVDIFERLERLHVTRAEAIFALSRLVSDGKVEISIHWTVRQ